MSRETKRATLEWREGLRFEGGEEGGPWITIDGDNAAAPGPMLQLLLAVAACSASDVVLILEKMRVRLERLRVTAEGDRREEAPRRYLSLRLRFHLQGEGLDEAKARRAIDLSLEKYCSVVHTLAADVQLDYEIELG